MKPIVAITSIFALLITPVLLGESTPSDGISLKKIVDELNREHPEKERKEIFDSPSKPVLFQLRSKFDLWNQTEKSEVRRFFESKGIDHPDWISGCIYDAWKSSQSGIEIDEERFLAKQAAIIRDTRAWNRAEEEEKELERDPFPPPNQNNDPFADLQPDVESKGEPREKSPQTVSLMIRGIDFAELRAKYREPLDAELKESGVGRVGVGVGDSTGDVESVGFDIEFSDFERGLPILRKTIRDLAFPAGTTLTFTRDGFAHKEYFKWHQRRARVE